MLDHQPVPTDSFKGLWNPVASPGAPTDLSVINKDNDQTITKEYGLVADNVDYGVSSVRIRERFGLFGNNLNQAIRRLFNLNNGEFLFASMDGKLYHWDTVNAPTLLITFPDNTASVSFLPWADRVYIVPSVAKGYFGHPNLPMQVYDIPTGTLRVAGGTAPTSPGANVAVVGGGIVDPGVHFFGVAFETDTGFITKTAPTNPAFLNMPPGQQVGFTAIKTGGSSVVARWLIMTRVIVIREAGDSLASYVSYFAHRIPDNTTTTFNLNLLDSQLLDDASYLNDIYDNPPGGSGVCIYRSRIVITAPTVDDKNKVVMSNVNDPETFDKVTGVRLIDPTTEDIVPNLNTSLVSSDTAGLTGCQAYRDTLYLTKLFSTYSLNDNGSTPDEWNYSIIDQTIGGAPNGIAAIRGSNKETVDYLIVVNPSGVFLFTGHYNRPQLSWKNRNLESFLKRELLEPASAPGTADTMLNVINDFINKRIFINTFRSFGNPHIRDLYILNYNNVDINYEEYAKNVKFSRWTFGANFHPAGMITTIDGKVLSGNIALVTDVGVWELGLASATIEDSVTVRIQLGSVREDGKIIHIGGVGLNITGNTTIPTTISMSLTDLNGGVPDFVFVPLTIDGTLFNSTIEPFIASNFKAQRPSLVLETHTDGELSINRIVQYAKPIFGSLPFQYYK